MLLYPFSVQCFHFSSSTNIDDDVITILSAQKLFQFLVLNVSRGFTILKKFYKNFSAFGKDCIWLYQRELQQIICEYFPATNWCWFTAKIDVKRPDCGVIILGEWFWIIYYFYYIIAVYCTLAAESNKRKHKFSKLLQDKIPWYTSNFCNQLI